MNLMESTGDHQEGREAQEPLGKGIVDIYILNNADINKEKEVAGKDCDSGNSAM